MNLENKGLVTMPYIVSEAPDLNDRRVVSLPARDRENLSYDFKPLVRGIIDIGTIRLGVTDVQNILPIVRDVEPG